MPLYSLAKKYILLYEKMSIYLCQKKYKQSYLLHRVGHEADTDVCLDPAEEPVTHRAGALFYAYNQHITNIPS